MPCYRNNLAPGITALACYLSLTLASPIDDTVFKNALAVAKRDTWGDAPNAFGPPQCYTCFSDAVKHPAPAASDCITNWNWLCGQDLTKQQDSYSGHGAPYLPSCLLQYQPWIALDGKSQVSATTEQCLGAFQAIASGCGSGSNSPPFPNGNVGGIIGNGWQGALPSGVPYFALGPSVNGNSDEPDQVLCGNTNGNPPGFGTAGYAGTGTTADNARAATAALASTGEAGGEE
ncbi:hypothetical protein P7C71_g2860, partial [Lecanoromycetidae sp. Uapishka_2]